MSEVKENETNNRVRVNSIVMRIKMWWISTFLVIDIEKAKKLNLRFYGNIYGDEINRLNCRSIWLDDTGRRYRVDSLSDYA